MTSATHHSYKLPKKVQSLGLRVALSDKLRRNALIVMRDFELESSASEALEQRLVDMGINLDRQRGARPHLPDPEPLRPGKHSRARTQRAHGPRMHAPTGVAARAPRHTRARARGLASAKGWNANRLQVQSVCRHENTHSYRLRSLMDMMDRRPHPHATRTGR